MHWPDNTPMDELLDEAGRYRDRAEELRLKAEGVAGEDTRRLLLDAAGVYEHLAGMLDLILRSQLRIKPILALDEG